MNRRDVLKWIAGGSLGVLASGQRVQARPYPLRTIQPKNPWDPARLPAGVRRKVLVVGGGLAGLSAALELAERGYEVDVDLVDAGFVPAMRSARTDLRSNMVNGMPRRRIAKTQEELRTSYRPNDATAEVA